MRNDRIPIFTAHTRFSLGIINVTVVYGVGNMASCRLFYFLGYVSAQFLMVRLFDKEVLFL